MVSSADSLRSSRSRLLWRQERWSKGLVSMLRRPTPERPRIHTTALPALLELKASCKPIDELKSDPKGLSAIIK